MHGGDLFFYMSDMEIYIEGLEPKGTKVFLAPLVLGSRYNFPACILLVRPEFVHALTVFIY